MASACFNCSTIELLVCNECQEVYCINCNKLDELFFKCSVCGLITCEDCGGCIYCDNCYEQDKPTYLCEKHATRIIDLDRFYCPKKACQKMTKSLK